MTAEERQRRKERRKSMPIRPPPTTDAADTIIPPPIDNNNKDTTVVVVAGVGDIMQTRRGSNQKKFVDFIRRSFFYPEYKCSRKYANFKLIDCGG
jgi:hypothetical protein